MIDRSVAMRQAGPARRMGATLPWLALALSAALLWLKTQQHALWLDDLYTIALVTGPLPDLMRAIVLGIDANPPLYMLLAWAAAQLPGAPEATLAALNVALGSAMLLALYRLARALVPRAAALTALALLICTNQAAVEPLMHLRTYPLFLLCVSLTALLALRLIKRGARRDALRLALACVALAMSHTFGLAYALMIVGGAALVRAREAGRRAGLALVYPVLPAVAVTALWVPALLSQMRIAVPYGWIEPPDWRELLRHVFPDDRAGIAGAALLVAMALMRARWFGALTWSELLRDRRRQAALLALAGFVLFAAALWSASWLIAPIFVTRYFAPSLLVYFGLVVCFAASLIALLPRAAHLPVAAASLALALLAVALAAPREGEIPCYDAARRQFIESGRIDPSLPVIAESPHAWFPRRHYAPTPASYIFPLDFDVVQRFPHNERNNAVDYNIMWHLRRIKRIAAILTTDELLARHGEFYVVNEQKRAWLVHLRRTHALQERVLAAAPGCALVHVRVQS